jgi:hypothetical protein
MTRTSAYVCLSFCLVTLIAIGFTLYKIWFELGVSLPSVVNYFLLGIGSFSFLSMVILIIGIENSCPKCSSLFSKVVLNSQYLRTESCSRFETKYDPTESTGTQYRTVTEYGKRHYYLDSCQCSQCGHQWLAESYQERY